MLLFAGVLLSLPYTVAAQSAPKPAFDVASVKPSKLIPGEGAWHSGITATPAGLTIRTRSLRDCIEWAWKIKSYQLSGPAWMDTEKYDIIAKAAGATPPDRLRLMLQTLLEERFQLALHHETRELPVYLMVAAKGGPKLRPTQADTSDIEKIPGAGLQLSFQRASLSQLADFLSGLAAIDRPVLEGTGLDRLYDFTLDLRAAAGPWASEAERQAVPPISAVVEEQLGLKLESRKQPVEVLVVDHARGVPTAN